MLRKVTQQAVAPEPMLAEVSYTPATPSWPPVFALRVSTLDTASWQTRAARGISWHRSGKLPQRRTAH
jgi:hypothetical protein